MNSKQVPVGEINSTRDLLKPQFKGKIIMRDPRLGSGGAILTIGTIRALKILEDDFYRELAKQEPRMFGGGSAEIARMVARGEAWVEYGAGAHLNYGPLLQEGADVRVVNPVEGTIGMPSTIQMFKDAPHPNAPRLFLNWLLSPEGQAVYGKVATTPSVRKDVPDYTAPGLRVEKVKKLLPSNWEVTTSILEQVKNKDMDKLFGSRC